MAHVHVESGTGPYAQTISVRDHHLTADEGPELGGTDSGPTPAELLLGALGSCVAITIKMYAARKGWDVQNVHVDVSGKDDHGTYVIERRLTFTGSLTDDQRERLTEIAGRCPVSRRLLGTVDIRSVS